MKPFYVYMLLCGDGSYYTGHTDDLSTRLAKHQSGLWDGYTSQRLPVKLVYSCEFPSRLEAQIVERRVKGWSRAKKEALMRGDWGRIHELARSHGRISGSPAPFDSAPKQPAPRSGRTGGGTSRLELAEAASTFPERTCLGTANESKGNHE